MTNQRPEPARHTQGAEAAHSARHARSAALSKTARRGPPQLRWTWSVTVLVLGAGLVAGCGAPPKTPGVAGLGPTVPAKVPATARSSGGLPSNFMSKLLSYAKCMRAHGISDFPDPTPGPGGQGGGFSIKAGPGSDLDPKSPEYKAANNACRTLLPYGGTPPPLTPAQLRGETKLAACMRTHGFPTFPDPNGQGVFVLHNIDLGSEQFQSTMHTCRTLVKYTGPIQVNASDSRPAGGQ